MVLTVAAALLALVSCEVAFPEETYQGTVAGGGSGTGGTGTGGTSGVGGGGNCFPSPSQKFCGGDLCPLKTDPTHGCANTSCAACSVPNATATCATDGTCTLGACQPGFTDCDGDPTNGCEVNTDQDPKNCGTCGHDCFAQNPGTNWVCQSGKCVVSQCPSGKGDCNSNAADGCEVDLTSDPKNCSFCGNDCSAAVLHATPTCTNSTCGFAACDPGWANCDNDPTNGCEQDIATDANNCGSCGNACSATNGLAACVNGQCTIGCQTGYGDCDGSKKNGCETNLDTDPSHCGACGTACSTVNATPTCVSGKCQLNCKTGWADCNANPSDGCETNITTVSNCGVCGNDCMTKVANANGIACSSGSCGYTSCANGWDNCDGNATNGCETDIAKPAACGSCSNDCTAQVLHVSNVTCSKDKCDYSGSCAAGYADCDANKANGCETALHTNSNCVTCGNACSGTKTCQYVAANWGCY